MIGRALRDGNQKTYESTVAGKMKPKKTQGFEDKVHAALKAAFSEVIKANPKQRFYTFAVFTDEALQFLHPVANTEEALRSTVKRYNETVDRKYGVTSTRNGMRWSYGDWAFFPDVGGGHFDKINRILSDNYDAAPEEYETYGGHLWDAVFDGFQRLEQEHFFGRGAARSKITLLIVGDVSSDYVKFWVSRMNPPGVVERYLNWDRKAADSD